MISKGIKKSTVKNELTVDGFFEKLSTFTDGTETIEWLASVSKDVIKLNNPHVNSVIKLFGNFILTELSRRGSAHESVSTRH